MTKEESIQEYKEYIVAHIVNVKRAFKDYGEELCKRLSIDPRKLEWQLEDHDRSKYSKEEFEPYRAHWHPCDDEKAEVQSSEGNSHHSQYDNAWMHHIGCNAHHPEHWVYEDENGNLKAYPMPKYYIAEMLLDWQSFDYDGKGSAYEYWNSDKCEKPLNPTTTEIINSVIDIFK